MQITLWEHCASAAFSLTLSGGCLWLLLDMLCPLMCVSFFPCPRSGTHVGTQVTSCFQTGMLHLWNLSPRWFLMSCYCLISWGWHGCSHPQRCPWSASTLWTVYSSKINGVQSWSCGGAEPRGAVLEVIGDEQLVLGCCWGEAARAVGQSSSGVTFSLLGDTGQGTEPGTASGPPHRTRTGWWLCKMIRDLWVKSSRQELPELAGQNCWSQFRL